MLVRTAFALLFGLIASVVAVVLALAATTADLQDFNASFDKDKNMHLEASAMVTAPLDKVFDAIAHPELTAKSDPAVDKTVISHQGEDSIVEIFGPQVPIPNAPKSLKIKVLPDKTNHSIEVDSYQSPILQFQNSYRLSPSKDGKSTLVKYSSTSNDISKQLGTDIPSDMRKTAGLTTFMNQMNRVADYIDRSAVAK